MLDAKTMRKLLMTAVVAALATTPVAAESPAQNCWTTPVHIGLFCNSGDDIQVCEDSNGTCSVSCGQGSVEVDSCG